MTADRAVLIGCVTVAAAVAACTPYWTPAEWPAQPLPRVIEVPGAFDCAGKRAIGCYWPPPANLIYITAGMPEALRNCVHMHEIVLRVKHSLGFKHDDRGGYAIDCGNGEMWMGETPR